VEPPARQELWQGQRRPVVNRLRRSRGEWVMISFIPEAAPTASARPAVSPLNTSHVPGIGIPGPDPSAPLGTWAPRLTPGAPLHSGGYCPNWLPYFKPWPPHPSWHLSAQKLDAIRGPPCSRAVSLRTRSGEARDSFLAHRADPSIAAPWRIFWPLSVVRGIG
jgi:hypothetical protein